MTNRPDRLNVVLETFPGRHRVDSPEIGWWLPVLGPTATVLAVTLVSDARDGRTRWDAADLARRIGLGGNLSKLWASLDRLRAFGCGYFAATDVIVLRAELPELNPRQLLRLPDSLAALYPTIPAASPGPLTGSSAFTAAASRPAHGAPDDHLEAAYEDRASDEAW